MQPGDWQVCFYCGQVMRYKEDYEVRAISDDEEQNMPAVVFSISLNVRNQLDAMKEAKEKR